MTGSLRLSLRLKFFLWFKLVHQIDLFFFFFFQMIHVSFTIWKAWFKALQYVVIWLNCAVLLQSVCIHLNRFIQKQNQLWMIHLNSYTHESSVRVILCVHGVSRNPQTSQPHKSTWSTLDSWLSNLLGFMASSRVCEERCGIQQYSRSDEVIWSNNVNLFLSENGTDLIDLFSPQDFIYLFILTGMHRDSPDPLHDKPVCFF